MTKTSVRISKNIKKPPHNVTKYQKESEKRSNESWRRIHSHSRGSQRASPFENNPGISKNPANSSKISDRSRRIPKEPKESLKFPRGSRKKSFQMFKNLQRTPKIPQNPLKSLENLPKLAKNLKRIPEDPSKSSEIHRGSVERAAFRSICEQIRFDHQHKEKYSNFQFQFQLNLNIWLIMAVPFYGRRFLKKDRWESHHHVPKKKVKRSSRLNNYKRILTGLLLSVEPAMVKRPSKDLWRIPSRTFQ